MTSPEKDIIARRYRLRLELGRGGQGEVWEADDLLTGGVVAIKLLHPSALEPARLRREVSALRLLDIPGVVRFLDEGVHEGRAFVVTEVARGAPFPGGARSRAPRPWSAMAGPTIHLLETLGRVHAVGIVHRDLKPDNVLVDEEGRAKVLDFGLAAGSALARDLTQAWTIVGTPEYLAPEQLANGAITPGTDLFAVGVILYECLTGRNPHEARDIQRLVRARLSGRQTSVQELAPDVPPSVADVIGRLLQPDAGQRPRSARAVLGLLRGEESERELPSLPHLGGDEMADAIVGELAAGRSVDVVGAPGSGRSHALRRALQRFEASGGRVVRALAAERPFASLEPLVAPMAPSERDALDDVLAAHVQRVREALAAGAALVCDPEEALDAWSRRVIARCLERGRVVRVRRSADTGVVAARTRALAAEDLEALFAGPDRLFHRREDAAVELHRRTAGEPRRIERELAAWVRAGVAAADGALFEVDRPRLDRLRLDERAIAVDGGARDDLLDDLPARLAELVVWVWIAGGNVATHTLAAALAEPLWLVEATLAELEERGILARDRDGIARCRPASFVAAWPGDRIREAHGAIADALPVGAEGRLSHLLASIDDSRPRTSELAIEATCAAAEWARRGRLGLAEALLDQAAGALCARRPGDTAPALAEVWEDLFALWVEIAVADRTTGALDRVVYQLDRTAGGRPALRGMKALALATLTLGSDGRRALAMLDALGAITPPALERRRHQIMMVAVRSASLAEEQHVWERACAFAEASGDPIARARALGWTGRLRYRQGRFEEAAELFAQSARDEPWVGDRIAAELNAASSLMEAFRPNEAREAGERARALAAEGRNTFLEARATWLIRAVDFRVGGGGAPDLDLVDAMSAIGARDMEALASMTEAAVAYRGGDAATARALAKRAVDRWSHTGSQAEAVVLMRSLAIACGEPASPEEIAALARDARAGVVPGMGIQSLGLLARARPDEAGALAVGADSLARQVDRARWGDRLDVMSVDEARGALRIH